MHTYRAAKHVRMGVPDEHAYNMFLSVMTICYRLGLWETVLRENRLHSTWLRLTYDMMMSHLKRKHAVEVMAIQADPRYGHSNGDKVSP